MNLNHIQAAELAEEIGEGIKKIDTSSFDIVICPSFISMQAVFEKLQRYPPIMLGAQNVSWEKSGALTGEISVEMLEPFGVKFVIIGHSERRHILKESNEFIANKIKLLVEESFTPILCVGETLNQRQKKEEKAVVERQIRNGLTALEKEQIKNIVIAYEPVWAIGTGQHATVSDTEIMIRHIREVLNDIENDVAKIIRILYGGSITPENIDIFMQSDEVDGVLVGGTSLKPNQFLEIIKYKERLPERV